MATEIRALTKDDLEELMPLIKDFWKFLNDLHEAQNKDFDFVRAQGILAETMDWRGHNIYGAFQEGKMVGFTDFWVLPDFFHGGNILNIQNLYIVPDQRGTGVGTVLMEKIIQVAKQQKVTDIHVDVLDENVDAQRFYEKLGIDERMVLLQGQFSD